MINENHLQDGDPVTAQRDLTSLEIAYSTWPRAAREARGSGAAVLRRMHELLTEDAVLVCTVNGASWTFRMAGRGHVLSSRKKAKKSLSLSPRVQ